MNLVWGLMIAVVVTAVAIAAMLVVRRRAPQGSRFADGDRAAGVFGFFATGLALLLGFSIFLGFTSYDDSRAGAEAEAELVVQQLETAQFLSSDVGDRLSGQLVCYARTVAGPEWRAMDTGTLRDRVNPWSVRMFHTMSSVTPQTNTEQSAYDRWMEQTSQRELARSDRLHGAEGIIPPPLWIALLLMSVLIFVFMLFFADPGEGAVTQAVMMGGVVMMTTVLLMLLMFFDHPHGEGVGRLQPTAMGRTLRLVDADLKAAGIEVRPPCDSQGNAR